MKLKLKITFCLLLILNYSFSQILKDSLELKKISIETEFGEITFYETCGKDIKTLSLNNFLSPKNIFAEKIADEAESKKIENDKIFIRLFINKKGFISGFKIHKESMLKEFNSYVNILIKEIQAEMQKQQKSFKCLKGIFITVPIIYNYN